MYSTYIISANDYGKIDFSVDGVLKIAEIHEIDCIEPVDSTEELDHELNPYLIPLNRKAKKIIGS